MNKKILALGLCVTLALTMSACGTKQAQQAQQPQQAQETKQEAQQTQMANPWTDCGGSDSQAAEIAGFDFDMSHSLSNYSLRAMEGMIEVTYPIDENQDVILRKSVSEDTLNEAGNNSGVYDDSLTATEADLDGTPIVLYFDKQKNCVIGSMAAESGFYSAYVEGGTTEDQIRHSLQIAKDYEVAKIDAAMAEADKAEADTKAEAK